MIARTTRANIGLANYLITGNKKNTKHSRDEKDNVVPLYGNLNIFKKTENYLNRYKNYKDNYLHITLAFSKEDMRRLDNLNSDDKLKALRDMSKEYISHHTSGYNLNNEVVAYAELHNPKIKEENGKERLAHIHIAIALYNPLNDTKLRTTFAKSSYIDDVLQAHTNVKYGLTQPRHTPKIIEDEELEYESQINKDRKYFIKRLKNIKDIDELKNYLTYNSINFKEVKTAYNHHIRIIREGKLRNINLRGKGFEHLQILSATKKEIKNEDKSKEELNKILSSFYQKRNIEIAGRRSIETTNKLNDISMMNDSKLPRLGGNNKHNLTDKQTIRPIAPVQYQANQLLKEVQKNNISMMVKNVVDEALNIAKVKSNWELKNFIKKSFNIDFCAIEKNSIRLKEIEIQFNDIGMDRLDLINALNKNRKENNMNGRRGFKR